MAKFLINGKKKAYPERICPERRQGSRRAFTLIEMLVSVGIVIVIASVAVFSLGSGRGATNVSNNSDEIKGLVDELKSFAYGPERERAAHYVLIIETTSPTGVAYCNKGLSDVNKLSKNQYMICETNDKEISTFIVPGDLNDKFSRVRAGGLNPEMTITPFSSNPVVINIRTYDGQIGYDLRYCESDSTHCGNPIMTLALGGQTKVLTLNSILGTFQ